MDGDSGLAYVYDADLQRRHPDQIITDILDKERQLRQLEEFPLGAHDDGPDALEGARTLSRRGRADAHISGLRV